MTVPAKKWTLDGIQAKTEIGGKAVVVDERNLPVAYCQQENAPLIAASPDLYDALEMALYALESATKDGWSDGDDAMWLARKVLKQARGESL